MWTCPTCKEDIEDTFDICWNCGTDTDGNANPQFQTADPAATEASSAPQMTAGKTKELGIFTIGIGMIFGALVLYANHISPANRPVNQLMVLLAIPLTFVVAGISTLVLRKKPVIIATTALVILGFAIDLFLALNPIKALISVGAAQLVIKTASQALAEIDSKNKKDQT